MTSDQELQSASLMQLAQKGDQAAYASLLVLLVPVTRQFARKRLGGSFAGVEDVVQETLIRAWKSREELKDPAAARPWLLTIVRREHARLFERKRLHTVDVDEVEALGDPALATDGDAGLADLRLELALRCGGESEQEGRRHGDPACSIRNHARSLGR